MAEYDTGLGWLAEEDWLKYTAQSVLGEVGGTFSDALPEGPVWDLSSAVLKLSALRDGYSQPWEWYYMSNGSATLAAVQQATGALWIYGFSTANNMTVYCHRYLGGSDQGDYSTTTTLDMSQYGYTGLYRTSGTINTVATNETVQFIDIPVYNSDTEMNTAVYAQLSSSTVTKDNTGFAVACVVKWKTQNGTELISPILISSETDYTDMTTDATGHYMAKFNGLLSGVRFYMAFWDFPGNRSITSQLPQLDLTDRGNITLEQLFMIIISTNNAHVIIVNSPDPYEEEGAGSGEEGGDGEELEDDDAGIEDGSDFPSAINTGFCRIFTPSESDLRDLSNYLWSNSYDLTQVKKLFSNPMDSILGLSAVPIRLLGSSVSFSLGGVPITGMTLPLVSKQRYTYHMGTITISERWGSYLDYDPYTKFSIFLPFIGMRDLSADDIMGKTIALVYDIDILTGMCVARLQAGTNCLYEWGGNCAIQLPINSRNWDSVFSTAVSAVGGIMSAVSGGSAPLVAGSVASAALQTVSMKPRIDKSSTIGGAAGWLGQMTPYIIRTTPEAFIPNDQNKFIGYPAYINVSLSAISGYNEVESIHLENVTATGSELEEIETILKGGVIF